MNELAREIAVLLLKMEGDIRDTLGATHRRINELLSESEAPVKTSEVGNE